MIRFGIAGTGTEAERFYQANRFGAGFELAAVYDVEKTRLTDFCRQKGKPACYEDFDAFAASGELDAVYLSGPAAEHYEQAAALLRAGKHVLIRSPFTWNEDQARDLFAIASEENVILLEAAANVYTPGFKKMISHVQSMGTIRRATFGRCRRDPDYDSYRRGIARGLFLPGISGGGRMELACLPAAAMVRLFGEPDDLKAFFTGFDSGVDAAGTFILKYADMIGEIQYSAVTTAGVPSQIQGEDASMLIREIENVKDLRIFRQTVKQTVHFEQSDNIMNYVTDAFMEMIRTGGGHEKAREDTLAVMRILDAAGSQMQGTD